MSSNAAPVKPRVAVKYRAGKVAAVRGPGYNGTGEKHGCGKRQGGTHAVTHHMERLRWEACLVEGMAVRGGARRNESAERMSTK